MLIPSEDKLLKYGKYLRVPQIQVVNIFSGF
jgi:hypothetical protein